MIFTFLKGLERFFEYNFFWVHFVTKVCCYFRDQRKNTNFLTPCVTNLKKKKISPIFFKKLDFVDVLTVFFGG